ncbi:MAG TPA: dihydrodipicolinate synthase family protein [Bryobacteraceae bacterium]|nr:dihydrodipicolinate synthase family protein [Bryobacteraceae bacterium]
MRIESTRRELLAGATAALLASNATSAMAVERDLRGAFIIMTTPFTESKALDYEDLAGEVAFLDRVGIQGLVWPQFSSELVKLSQQERMRGMDVLAGAVRGKKPTLILGVQGADTAEMLEYAQHAESLAPDAMIAIPPTKAKSLDDYREYYRALCKLAKRPVFTQTSGGAPGLELSIDFMVDLAREFPNFGYIKEEHDPVIARMRALIAHRPDPIKRVFGANFGIGSLYEMRIGSDGTITGGAMYGDIYAKLWDLHRQNKMAEKRELFSKLSLMLNLDKDIPGARLYLMKKRGIFKTSVSRIKETRVTPQEIAEIDYRFEALKPWLA